MVYMEGEIPVKDTCSPQVKQYPVLSFQNLHSSLGMVVRRILFPCLCYSFSCQEVFSCSSLSKSSFHNHFFTLLKLPKNKHHQQHCTSDLYSPLGAKLIHDFVQELPKSSILPITKKLHGQSCERRLPRTGVCCAHLHLVLPSPQLHSPNVIK